MAKKATRRPAAGKARTSAGKAGKASRTKSRARPKSEGTGAADALVGLLESPLVAEIIAAGAAASAAAITQQALSRKSGGGNRSALKQAAKAAAAAMGARLSTEFDEIMKSAKANSKAGKA
jgi:hypothetical protein